MTEYAPVAPLSGLRRLAQAGELGHYQLVIAPVVLSNSWAYGQFFHEDYPTQFTIVDNGVIEQGVSVDARALWVAVCNTNASVVVMPDTIDDAKMTIKQTRVALAGYRRLDPDTAVMGVVQGTTLQECLWCADELVKEGVNWLAVPRGLTPNLGSRVPLVRALAVEFGKPMHILGFSDNIADDLLAATAHDLVRGIDAATPMWWPGSLPAVPPDRAEETLALGRRPGDFWQSAVAASAPKNVAQVRWWLSELNAARTARTEQKVTSVPADPPAL